MGTSSHKVDVGAGHSVLRYLRAKAEGGRREGGGTREEDETQGNERMISRTRPAEESGAGRRQFR